MDQTSEEAPLAADSRAGSEQVLIQPHGAPSPGGSNSRALKIAGITTLVCLLVSAQVFTAYMVFDQKQQIQELHTTNQKIQTKINQRPRMPKQIVKPLGSMPLLDVFADENTPKPSPKPANPLPKVQLKKAPLGVEEQLQDFMEDFELPHFNSSFLANLQSLKQQVNETSWKNFESWMRYWLIFQMAQNAHTPYPAPEVKTKCQSEAAVGLTGMLGTYRPQCDEQGNYRTVQCWHGTGQCWCVDESGTMIQGSGTRGHPDCDKFLRSRQTGSNAMMMSGLLDVTDK